MTEVVDLETGEITTEPTTIEDMIAATMTHDEDAEAEREAEEGDETGSDEEGDESGHGEYVLTAEDAERQAAEHAAMRASMKATEKAFKARDTRVGTYTQYMEGWATEQEQPLVRCPLCLPETPGFIYHPEQVPLNQDQITVLNILLGQPIMPDFQTIPQANACPVCQGEGTVLTGSKVTNKRTITCPECKGDGWVGEAKNLRPELAAAAPYLPPTVDGAPPEELPALDPWGTPDWDPDFYKMPQGRTPGWDNGTGVWVHPDQRVGV